MEGAREAKDTKTTASTLGAGWASLAVETELWQLIFGLPEQIIIDMESSDVRGAELVSDGE